MDKKEKQFISGVVEGFYGKPWTKGQRLTLFERLKNFGLTTYMYAPKDDTKHRKNWRDQYIEAEKENLKTLIKGAESNGINFVYALSPGIDIIFSCPKDVKSLKNKMKQVADLGCKYFALLFDDIEPELSLPDKLDFASFADAQVTITNQVYEDIGSPDIFLFCPTEYCTTRAKPSVEKSEYLITLGKNLHENIDILWTGPKVVSKQISIASTEAVAKVLKRKPVIWDNIHANDYDQRRVFLGPYDGRPTNLYKHVNGILTNPNCEYECNFIALHTLATWINRCSGNKSETISNDQLDSSVKMDIGEDIKQRVDDSKTEKDSSEPMGVTFDKQVNNEDAKHKTDDQEVRSLKRRDDSSDDASQQDNGNKFVKSDSRPMFPSNQSASGAYDPESALRLAVFAWLKEFKKIKAIPKALPGFSSSPSKIAVSDNTNSLMMDSSNDGLKDSSSQPTAKTRNMSDEQDTSLEIDDELDEEIQCCRHHSPVKGSASPKKKAKRSDIDDTDLLLLSDLFFLPYEHGKKAKQLISEFKWLKQNTPSSAKAKNKKNKSVEEWKKRASSYHDHCQAVLDLFLRLSQAPNQELVQEIYPYIWDVKEVVMLLNAFVKWLGSKDKKCKEGSVIIPEDPEPWIFRGGIAGELERLLPIDGGSDILSRKPPSVITQDIYTIRPYLDGEKETLYELCVQTCDDGHDGRDLFPRYRELAGDKYIGAYLQHSRGLTFVVEGDHGLCGYCVAASDTKAFNIKYKEWLSKIANKYTRPTGDPEGWNIEEELIESIHKPLCFLPSDLYAKHPAHISINLLSRAKGTNIGKRLLACLMSVLKADGVHGVYSEVSASNIDAVGFYTELGFREVKLRETSPDNILILGRNI